MKLINKSLLLILALMSLFSSCTKDLSFESSNLNPNQKLNSPDVAALTGGETGRACSAMDVLDINLQENPGLAQKMEAINKHAESFARGKKGASAGATPQDIALAASLTSTQIITIPVVVNVIYSNAQENLSDAQIQSQITVLNQDFSYANADKSLLANTVFSNLGSTFNIQFTLFATNRKASNKTSWGTRDAMKSTKKGGIDPTDPTHKLNLWVCNIGGGILGYAQFPGGNSATDGVVIGPQYFGSSAYANTAPPNKPFYFEVPYDLGRTATHEIGHWLNLRHIWGDATCGNDFIADTPVHNTSNGGCPNYPHLSTCTGTPIEMTMNYMDYTYDACMYMFSIDQNTRARAVFAAGGPRVAFVQ